MQLFMVSYITVKCATKRLDSGKQKGRYRNDSALAG